MSINTLQKRLHLYLSISCSTSDQWLFVGQNAKKLTGLTLPTRRKPLYCCIAKKKKRFEPIEARQRRGLGLDYDYWGWNLWNMPLREILMLLFCGFQHSGQFVNIDFELATLGCGVLVCDYVDFISCWHLEKKRERNSFQCPTSSRIYMFTLQLAILFLDSIHFLFEKWRFLRRQSVFFDLIWCGPNTFCSLNDVMRFLQFWWTTFSITIEVSGKQPCW